MTEASCSSVLAMRILSPNSSHLSQTSLLLFIILTSAADSSQTFRKVKWLMLASGLVVLDTQQRFPNGQLNIDLRRCIMCTIIVPRTLPRAIRDVDCTILCKTLSAKFYEDYPSFMFCYGESPYSYCKRCKYIHTVTCKYRPFILLVVSTSHTYCYM